MLLFRNSVKLEDPGEPYIIKRTFNGGQFSGGYIMKFKFSFVNSESAL